jgi:hypothetical protein
LGEQIYWITPFPRVDALKISKVSRGLGRVQKWVLLCLYRDRNLIEWCNVWWYRPHDRQPGAQGTARHRAHRASVRRGVRRLAELGLVEYEVKNDFVRQIDIHGDMHRGGVRAHLVAKITPAGIDYIRERGLDPEYTNIQRLRRIVDSFDHGGPSTPYEVWERCRFGSPYPIHQRLFTMRQAADLLIRRGVDPRKAQEVVNQWLSDLKDLTVPDYRAHEVMFTYEEVQWIRDDALTAAREW